VSQGAYIVLGHVQSPLGPFDQDAWIVTFPNVCIELFGPPGTPSETLGTDYEVIDAATGSWMFGFSTGRPWNPVAVRRICERQSSAAN
jgi:hypothetical protein